MAPPDRFPPLKNLVAAAGAVAAVYVYFLIFAQFGFLKTVQAVVGREAGAIRPVMGVMGLAGIAGSAVAAWLFTIARGRVLWAMGLAVCAVAAAGSLGARSAGALQACAALVGLGTGLATVTLAALLRASVGARHLGRVVGPGTGLAYALCNVPVIFEAGAAAQAGVALLAVAAGLAATAGLGTMAVEPSRSGDHAPRGVAAWVAIFFVLVGLDSAAFFVIQQAPALKAGLWGGPLQLALNAGVHLVVAMLAGWALDRGRLSGAVAAGATCLLAACALLVAGETSAWAAASYVAGVSLYSVALVHYPASSGRAGLAALVYITAGWMGSGLGIGLMAGRDRLPWALPAGAAIFLIISLGDRILARPDNKE